MRPAAFPHPDLTMETSTKKSNNQYHIMADSISFKGRRFLVTGGGGFLGSHLCEALLSRGGEVIVADDFITGRKKNVAHLVGNPAFQLVEQDVTQPLEIYGELAGIFHMASPASPVDFAKYPIETLRVGAMAADNILALARKKNCPGWVG